MSEEEFKEQSLRYHREPRPGKLEITATTPLATQSDLARAYSPGVAYACTLIEENPAEAANMTARGNLVGVISNGTAVLGLGDIGALASKPVMEGKAVLFKRFANIDVFDIEVDETEVDKFVDLVAALEPTFGGINLEDIKAPQCFEIERKCRERMNIPVFHDDQHGTAIVAAAAVYNSLHIVGKNIDEVTLVVSGAGAAAIACVDLVVSMGLRRENVYLCDSRGVVYLGREAGMNEYKAAYAQDTEKRTLQEAIVDADIFFGLSGPGALNGDDVAKMAERPIILAMANPVPEILPEEAKAARPDCIMATGRSDYPNQVNNVLCFPFIFRGALDCGATTINEEMKIACVKAIAELARRETTAEVAMAYAGEQLRFGPEYIIPKPFDARLIETIPPAVAQAAMDSGVAARPIEDLDAYRSELSRYVVRSSLFMQPVVDMARRGEQRLVYAEGENESVLRAVQQVLDEEIATPLLVGRPGKIQEVLDRLGLRFSLEQDVEIIDLDDAAASKARAVEYHKRVGRRGYSPNACAHLMRTDATAVAAMLVASGHADGILCGTVGRFAHHLRHLREIIGLKSRDTHMSSLTTVLLDSGPIFLTDCFLGFDPSVEDLVASTMAAVGKVRQFGITPRVALLSHSNFGSSTHPAAAKMRRAGEKLRELMPELEIDGEMHSITALDPAYRKSLYEHSTLLGPANLLVMPSLDAANIALGLLTSTANGLQVGPFLSGFARPAHIMINTSTPRAIFNMSALTAADIELGSDR